MCEAEVVGIGFLIELEELNGRKILDTNVPIKSLLAY